MRKAFTGLTDQLLDEFEQHARARLYARRRGVERTVTSSRQRCCNGRAATTTAVSDAGRGRIWPSTCSARLPAQSLGGRPHARHGTRVRPGVPGGSWPCAAASQASRSSSWRRRARRCATSFWNAGATARNWGLAKSMVMQMQAEGIDPSAPGALDAWIEDFNARAPRSSGTRSIGPAAERMARAARLASTAGARAPKQKAQRRKAQRQVRASATDEADAPTGARRRAPSQRPGASHDHSTDRVSALDAEPSGFFCPAHRERTQPASMTTAPLNAVR